MNRARINGVKLESDEAGAGQRTLVLRPLSCEGP